MKAPYIIIFYLVLAGCKSNNKAYSEITPEGYLKETKVSRKNSNKNCFRTEYNVVKDTATAQILSKEILKYDCKASLEKLISCKKWKLENNKLVLQKINCKPQKF